MNAKYPFLDKFTSEDQMSFNTCFWPKIKSKAIVCLGYKQGQGNHNLFFEHSRGKLIVLLCMLMILWLQEITSETV